MAPSLVRGIEIVFFVFVLILFIFIANKYYGDSVYFESSQIVKSARSYLTYHHYKLLAEDIDAPPVEEQKFESSVPILVYHGVVSRKPKSDEEIPLKNFEEQMFALKENGYQTISTDDFYQFINNGKQLPDKSFILTFDDGRKDSYYPVDPILESLGYKATIFVITNTLSLEKPSPYYLSTDELKMLLASGRWEIQSHGRDDHGLIQIDADGKTGRFLSNKKWLSDEQRLETDDEYRTRIFNDLANSKNDIKDNFDVDAIAYALPAGDYGHKNSNYLDAEQVIQSVIKEVFPMTFYQFNPDWKSGYYRENHVQDDGEQYFFRRVKVFGDFDTKKLLDILDAGHKKSIPYVDNFSNKENWILGWGKIAFDNNILTLQNDETSSNAAAFMDGSLFWENYSFNANARLMNGTYYGLLARVKNGKNFVACTFGNKKIKSFIMEDGIATPLGEMEMPDFDATASNGIGITVNNNRGECLLDGNVALTFNFNMEDNSGGTGIMVYSENKDVPAQLNITGPVFVFNQN